MPKVVQEVNFEVKRKTLEIIFALNYVDAETARKALTGPFQQFHKKLTTNNATLMFI